MAEAVSFLLLLLYFMFLVGSLCFFDDFSPSNHLFQAVAEKNLGNEAYKKKDFATAHVHYDKAIELDPANATFHSNKAG